MFEDEKGEERIYLHAQKDNEIHVQNNRAKRVDVSEVESIGNSKYSEIGKDFNFPIGGNAVTAIGVAGVSLSASKPMAPYDDSLFNWLLKLRFLVALMRVEVIISE